MHLIVGTFFRTHAQFSTAETLPHFNPKLLDLMYYGILYPKIHDKGQEDGIMRDHFGDSYLYGAEITYDEISFWKHREREATEREVRYRFHRKEGDVWVGEYTAVKSVEGIQEGIGSCVVTEFDCGLLFDPTLIRQYLGMVAVV